ncbi:MAG TPA: hypothetical protein DD670_05030 [Planctomycetaceae bacterium]|nr:hypothetical protein [Planctomycetaceae bacterium]
MIRRTTQAAALLIAVVIGELSSAGPIHAQMVPERSRFEGVAVRAEQPVQRGIHLSATDFDFVSPSDESPEPRGMFDGPVTLESLIGHALANNPEIQAARFHARSLGARVPQAKSLPDPQLMATAFLEEIQTAAGPQQAAVSLSQKFPWFGKRTLRSQVAHFDSVAAYARVAAVELKVIEGVKRAYYDLYFVQSAVEENRRLMKPLEDVIAVAKSKYETSTGEMGMQDVLQAQVELSQLKINLIALDEGKRQAQARLAGLLHLPPRTRPEASNSVFRSELDRSVETLVALADVCQPEFVAFRRELARDQSAVEVARRDYWPDVTMGLNWYEIGDRGLSPVANGRDALSLGVGVNLPIYRSRLDGAVNEAQYKQCATARRYAAVRDQFQIEIETLYAQFREHHQTLRILTSEVMPRAEEALKLTTESYRAGRADFEQLMDVYRTLLRYRIELHRHVALREQAIASLERAVGTAVTTPVQDGSNPAIESLHLPSSR